MNEDLDYKALWEIMKKRLRFMIETTSQNLKEETTRTLIDFYKKRKETLLEFADVVSKIEKGVIIE